MPLRRPAGTLAAILVLAVSILSAAGGEAQLPVCLQQPDAGAVVPEPEPDDDMDGDGLSDEWENQYFGNLRDQSGTDDPDGDGENNLAEMQAETNPLDPADH